ncbi:MAG: efflux RND transporter periplasmic adaptor subunit [Oxalicibacterium faecigallinarum]|uniref:efflux RND transporter periplasmic adaptor subunit n=1 Tax=Oxalicibacterium faecigallinarum TaxID=573741 RepID=UPI00280765CA|nr:efflux RND transporter periplasmic adaptor subunit [Oxalicibacterium faecigallinarum]MDQ7968028.1 efflux RND transporter periplasmic adaptor subunit [Oxalicibacterium faecigallinarum]
MSSLPRLTRISASLFLIFALAACGKKNEAPAAPPPTEVSVVTINAAPLAVTNELPARLESSRIAEVRARVAGIVLKRNFREGADVKAGELLYQIDPAQFQANYNSADAAVQRAEATLLQAEMTAKRYKPLVETNAVSKLEYDNVVATEKQATADLVSAKAARETARLSLGYANVTSPISGRIGRALVTEGALVGQNEATPLAVVQQIDPIYVNMTQSSTEVLRLQRAMAAGQLKSAGKDQVKITLVTEDGQVYPHPGKLLFSDLTVDETSGAVSLRAEFSNPERTLLPGMYVRARVEQAVNDSAITVPQQAVTQTPGGSAVMVVGEDNKVTSRLVKTGSSNNNNWVIESGLKSGERVIVEGLQKVQPGATVKPVPWKKAANATDAAAPEAAAPATPAAAETKQPAANAPASQKAEQPQSK